MNIEVFFKIFQNDLLSYLQITLGSITLCNCEFQRFIECVVYLQRHKHKIIKSTDQSAKAHKAALRQHAIDV